MLIENWHITTELDKIFIKTHKSILLFYYCPIKGLIAPTAVWICLGLPGMDSDVAKSIGLGLKYVFMFVPTFNFGRSIMAVAQVCAYYFKMLQLY